MKAKINPDIEFLLLPLCYLEQLSKQSPEFKRAIELLPFFNRFENIWKDIENLKANLSLAIIIPEYKFSKILSRGQYNEITEKSIADIKSRYLDIPNNKLTPLEKESIINGLEQFYSETEFSLIPFYNQFRATKDDRSAYIFLSVIYIITLGINLFDLMRNEQKRLEQKINDSNTQMKLIQTQFEDEIKSLSEKQSVSDNPEENIEALEQIKTIYKQLQIDDDFAAEKAIAKVNSEITDEGMDLMMHYFKLKPEENRELNSNQLFNGLSVFKVFEDDTELDNKKLESRYIRLIYEQVEKTFGELSKHRLYIITGFIAMNFGIINESDWKPATSVYKTLSYFLRDRVKGIITKG